MEKRPPGSPPLNPKTLTSNGHRPARRDSLSKPGASLGPQLPGPPLDSDHGSAEEVTVKYIEYLAGEEVEDHQLLSMISEHLPAPSLDGLDPESVSLNQASEGIMVLIPGSPPLQPGDSFNLLWGGVGFPSQTLDEDTFNQPVIGRQLVIHSPTSFLQQGKVKVCYDIYRNQQRIGTSAILYVNVHDSYTPGENQLVRKRLIKRRHNRR
ncbi:hypothetical protein [Pseudomonas sp. NA-150]|uniref:hypothetical protein n=1 Tax=Pseudomonas sp. NA-150 TaxID=3367525 RepID=UPI0037CA3C95